MRISLFLDTLTSSRERGKEIPLAGKALIDVCMLLEPRKPYCQAQICRKSIKLHLFMATGTASNICQATPNNLPYVSHQGAEK